MRSCTFAIALRIVYARERLRDLLEQRHYIVASFRRRLHEHDVVVFFGTLLAFLCRYLPDELVHIAHTSYRSNPSCCQPMR